jgi:hypothetical protein
MLALSLVSHRDCLQHAGHQLLGSFHFVYSMMNASVDIHLETENSAGGFIFRVPAGIGKCSECTSDRYK